MAAGNVLELIGNTPLVEVKRLQARPCRLFLKLENQNPGGSIKDRIALSMIGAAESEGRIKPGDLLVEATAGNTGLGLALVAAQKGYRLRIVVPDKMSQEKIFHLRAMGAEVVMTRSDVTKGHPEYYQDLAARLARETPGAFYIDQFANPANPRAHEETTGPEIWEQMEHQVDAVVAGVGTVVTLVCDSGNKYLSKVYNDYWMLDQGFIQRERFGDLRDLIARRHREHAVATVNADEAVLNAYQRMKLYDVSQLPVLEDGKIVGILDEEDILLRVADNPGYFRRPVTEAMESHLVTVPPDATLAQLMDIFKRGMVAIVVDRDEFLGLITRIDLLNWLRRRATEK